MASAKMTSLRTISGNQPAIRAIIEDAAMTFLEGVPVMINNADGGVKEWDGTTVALGVAGISKQPAGNLTTLGVGKQLTFGAVPNQPAAVKIARGGPFSDGRHYFEVANEDTIFFGEVGPAQVPVAADVGKQYGMTKDSDGHWYVDRTKATVGTNTVVVISKLDPFDARGVHFQFVPGARQLLA